MAECSNTKKLHLWNPREVAVELCIMDAEVLRRILPTELEGGAWMKRDTKHVTSPNVMAMVGMFNQLALIIPTEILTETTPQSRAKVITAYIQIASKCHSAHNYNSLKAVLAGLQCTPIFRLDKSWKEVPSRRKKRFQALTKLMSEEMNWHVYRKELEPKILSDFSFIPFLGVFLTDVALSQEARSLAKKNGRQTERALYETYTILEPITIRHKLEKLRSNSSQNLEPSSVLHSDSDHDESTDSFISYKSIPSPLPLLSTSSERSYYCDSDWDVTEWLTQIGLQEYAESFIDNGYENAGLCGNISGKEMTELGVTSKLHRSELVKHARKLLEVDSCHLKEENTVQPKHSKKTVVPMLGAVKDKKSFSGTLSNSLECLMSAVQSGDSVIRSYTYEKPEVMIKSSSLQSLNDMELNDMELKDFKRTQSDTTTENIPSKTHRRTQSENINSFSGLPPQLPLHSQQPSHHVYSPNKDTSRSKSEASPLKETSAKIKSWIHDHQYKGSFPVLSKKKSKPLLNKSSSPVLIQRPRRASATVPKLRASQLAAKTCDSKNPVELLSAYQLSSLGCSAELVSNPELRHFITSAAHNTEALNYKLSYQLESD